MPLSASSSCLSAFSFILFGHANAFDTLLVCMKVQLFLMLLFPISGSSLFSVLPRLQPAKTSPLLGQETSSRAAESSWLFYLNAFSRIKDITVEWRRTHVHAILFVPSHLCPRSKVHILIIWYPASLFRCRWELSRLRTWIHICTMTCVSQSIRWAPKSPRLSHSIYRRLLCGSQHLLWWQMSKQDTAQFVRTMHWDYFLYLMIRSIMGSCLQGLNSTASQREWKLWSEYDLQDNTNQQVGSGSQRMGRPLSCLASMAPLLKFSCLLAKLVAVHVMTR